MKIPFLPEQASNFAREYDALFWLLSFLTILFTMIVMVLALTFINKYRRGKPADRSNPVHHNSKLEALFLFAPLGLALGIFAWGAKIFVEMREPPENAMEIFVVGKRWMWHVQHQNGTRENNTLHVPVGQPVKLTIISQDVIHGLYIPQFRVQYHAVPGRYTTLWFTATKAGRYNLFCSMHCGTQHSEMGGYVYAVPPDEFTKWLDNGGNQYKPIPKTMVQSGQKLWEELNCASCHGATDTKRGPALAGISGKTREFEDGTSMVADRAYLREALVHPYSKILKGYENSMQTYEDLTEDEINALIEYMKTLGTGSSDYSPNPSMSEAPTRSRPDGGDNGPDSLDMKGVGAGGNR